MHVQMCVYVCVCVCVVHVCMSTLQVYMHHQVHTTICMFRASGSTIGLVWLMESQFLATPTNYHSSAMLRQAGKEPSKARIWQIN